MAEPIRRVLFMFDYGCFLWVSRTGAKPFDSADWSSFDVAVPADLRRRCEEWHRREENLTLGTPLDSSAQTAEGRKLATELSEALGVPVDYVE